MGEWTSLGVLEPRYMLEIMKQLQRSLKTWGVELLG